MYFNEALAEFINYLNCIATKATYHARSFLPPLNCARPAVLLCVRERMYLPVPSATFLITNSFNLSPEEVFYHLNTHITILSLFKYFFHYLILFKAFVLSNTLQLSVQGSSVTASTPVPLLPLVQFLCLYVKFDIKFNFDSDLIEKSSLHELRQ